MDERFCYNVYATDMDGRPLPDVVVTLKPQPAGTVVYREYWTGPRRPWWRRLLHRRRDA